MDAYEALLRHFRVGSKISGIVTAHDKIEYRRGLVWGHIELETHTGYRARLPYHFLVDDLSSFSPSIVPEIGAQVDAVVFNFVDDTLILSAKPSDLLPATISRYQEYYRCIDSLTIGSTIIGIVANARPFGLFVDIGVYFAGLIDIGHISFNGGVQLPPHCAEWPKVGDKIRCRISYFRFRNQQIGLGWLPETDVQRQKGEVNEDPGTGN